MQGAEGITLLAPFLGKRESAGHLALATYPEDVRLLNSDAQAL